MIEVILPNLTWTLTEAKIVKWLKGIGDQVVEGEPLFEAEMEKSVVEVESPGSGTLAEILVEEGTTIPYLTPVAMINDEK